MANRMPETVFKLNGCSATIWKNSTQTGYVYNTTIKKSYKDQSGAWKDSESFGMQDLPTVAVLAQMATAWIIKRREYDKDNSGKGEQSRKEPYRTERDEQGYDEFDPAF